MSEKKNRKKKMVSGRFAILIIVLLFVCALIFFGTRATSGSLRRLSYSFFNGVRGDATEASVYFDANEYNKYSLLNDNLCIVSPQELSVYKINGNINFSEPVLLRSPTIAMSKTRFIAYDLGGVNFYVADKGKILHSAVSDFQITNVNINNSGEFAIVSNAPDSKNLVTIYNSEFEAIYKFHSAEKYVFDAAVSKNAKEAAILSYGTKDGKFSAAVSLCKTNENGFFNTVDLGDSMPLKISYLPNNKIYVVCEDKFTLLDNDGNIISEISFNGLPVKAFSDSLNNRVVVLLDDYKNGGNSKLICIDGNGSNLGELTFDEDIYSVSCTGKYTSVQLAEKCIVYDDELSVRYEFAIPTTITECLVGSDSSVVSIGANYATLYIQ